MRGSARSKRCIDQRWPAPLDGMWPLLLVFFASFTVPVLKLLRLIVLLIATQRRSAWRLRGGTALYRNLETVGRWSMIDIFTGIRRIQLKQ